MREKSTEQMRKAGQVGLADSVAEAGKFEWAEKA